jgi:hypothetical protein
MPLEASSTIRALHTLVESLTLEWICLSVSGDRGRVWGEVESEIDRDSDGFNETVSGTTRYVGKEMSVLHTRLSPGMISE